MTSRNEIYQALTGNNSRVFQLIQEEYYSWVRIQVRNGRGDEYFDNLDGLVKDFCAWHARKKHGTGAFGIIRRIARNFHRKIVGRTK